MPLAELLFHIDDPRDLLPRLVESAVDEAGADGAAIVEVAGAGLARVVASARLPPALADWRGEVDAIDDALARALVEASGGRFAEAQLIPMLSGGDLFGAMALFFAARTELEPDRRRLAEGLTDLAALAIGKAFQGEELHRAYAEVRSSRMTLERTQKLRSLGEMAAGVVHDLKNVLNPLALHLQLLRRQLAGKGPIEREEALESVAEMEQVVRRGVEMLERMRSFSRQAPERAVELADLNALAPEALAICKPRLWSVGASGASKLVFEPGAVAPVRLHSAELVAALVNLVVNAIEALAGKGTIRVSTGSADGGSWVRVDDDGPGMPAEVKRRIFEPFFTTKGQEGTGLGLAMVYAFALRHGGRLTVDSAPGEGSAFLLWFPHAEPQTPAAP